MSTSSTPVRPIIIVTGANKYVFFFHRDAFTHSGANTFLRHSGIGFGICHRLLHNILQNSTTPDDASPLFPRSGAEGEPQGIEYPCAGLTLIMACRSRQRAEDARKKLLQLFEDDVARFLLENSGRGAETERRRVEKFCENLIVAVHLLDLASVQSTLSFADEVART
jgi:3-keto steroid reductase